MQSSIVTAALGNEDSPRKSEEGTEKKKDGSQSSPKHYANHSISSVDKSMLSIDTVREGTSPVSETEPYS
jgi:hypothetical protein